MKLTYFGEEYYERSGSIIGVLYTHDGERSDWGKVNVALRNGESVEITPASPAQHRAIEAQTVRAIERAKAAGFGGPWGPPKANIKFRDAGGQSPALRTDDQPHSL